MDTQTKTWTRYSAEQQAAALVRLAENAGNVEKTARELDMPPATLRTWRDAAVSVPPANIVAQRRLERAEEWEAAQDAGVAQILAKIGEASARDAAVIAGIATEKALLLRGEATSITESRDDARVQRLRERYSALRARQPIDVTPTATTTPEAAPPIETTDNPGENEGEG